jgi:hypothetical protein
MLPTSGGAAGDSAAQKKLRSGVSWFTGEARGARYE